MISWGLLDLVIDAAGWLVEWWWCDPDRHDFGEGREAATDKATAYDRGRLKEYLRRGDAMCLARLEGTGRDWVGLEGMDGRRIRTEHGQRISLRQVRAFVIARPTGELLYTAGNYTPLPKGLRQV